MRRLCATLLLVASSVYLYPQSSMGISGLLNSPSAVMSKDGTVKIGGNFLNTNMTPDTWDLDNKTLDYNTFNFFLNITFLPFLEVAITNTALDYYDEGKFTNVDRAVCLKFRILKEGKYWPSVVIGSNDVLTSATSNLFDPAIGNKFFGTHYLALSKHIDIAGNRIGVHAAYNILSSTKQTINFPLSGGISFSPNFYKELNLIAEYDTRNFNLGGNILIFKYLYLQLFVQDLKYLSFGAQAQFSIL
ncbi:MAG: YjbH domain-containing protein [Bacteroidales bacterium]|nr:YjbH domain-containing protein [Bacteroidales bacterium]